ncbi:aspartic proteinase nepenthesin-1-like [Triticum aestivum]|uniref:aspartic proteinase nepenthesin-1-like n=1 Tax=Triticum aestivum TaxID=4565 RepID=UPI001D002E76|nr:aspartic proteinase nepenthesin-1-like [Triticum aestivum]
MLPVLGEHQCRVQDDNLCGYVKPYYTGATSGFRATETFSFGATPVKGVVFGCSGDITVPNLDGASGFAGFSRGPLSLVSQLKISSFTYFISPPGGKNASARARGHLRWSWGAGADYTALQTATTTTGGGGGSSSTLLLPATEHQNPYLYYVNLTGVQVEDQLLTAIPAGTFDVRHDGSGGVYLSTTLPFTYLDKAAYNVLRPELVSRIQSQGVFPVNVAAGGNLDRVCFLTQDLAKAKVPTLALLFNGADAAMELKVENYFFADDSGQTCLTILPSAATGSVLGSLLQAGRKMTYDIYGNGGGRLTFETAPAGAPVPEWASLMIMATLLWMFGSQALF